MDHYTCPFTEQICGFEIQSSEAFRGSSPCPVSSLPTPGSYCCGRIPVGCVMAETKCECGRKKSNPSYISHPQCVGGSSSRNPQTQHTSSISWHLCICHNEMIFIKSNQEQKNSRAALGPHMGNFIIPLFLPASAPDERMRV